LSSNPSTTKRKKEGMIERKKGRKEGKEGGREGERSGGWGGKEES
jgi:hypothetical protein